jgi:hypothetical protein
MAARERGRTQVLELIQWFRLLFSRHRWTVQSDLIAPGEQRTDRRSSPLDPETEIASSEVDVWRAKEGSPGI